LTSDGVYPGEMKPSADEHVFDELLEKGRSDGPSTLRGLPDFVTETRRVFSAPPRAEVRRAHLAAMKEVVARGVSPAAPRRRRRRTAAKVGVLSAGFVLVAGSAMAATGTLPDAAQHGLSVAVAHVGITIPNHGLGFDADDEHPTTPATDGTTPAAENKARAKRFTDAKKTWTACVAAAAKAHEGDEAFDPETACGPKPSPEAAGPKEEKPKNTPASEQGQQHGSSAGAGQSDTHPTPNSDPGQPDDPGSQGAEHSAGHGPG